MVDLIKILTKVFPHHTEASHPLIALVGQPNCGKSTLFNHVAGYRSISTNFPGTTVSFTASHVQLDGQTFDLVDLPGIYSLSSGDKATEETIKFLLEKRISLIINVIDASLLCRSLELTLQLLEYGLPMMVCLNMMDEAERKGILIDVNKLSSFLHLDIVTTIADKGVGVDGLFKQALLCMKSGRRPHSLTMTHHVESAVVAVSQWLSPFSAHVSLPQRLLAIKLLEGDVFFQRMLPSLSNKVLVAIKAQAKKLAKAHDRPPDMVIAAEYHAAALHIFEQVAIIREPRKSWRNRLDDYLMHPVAGYVWLLLIFLSFFLGVFKLGAYLEAPILAFFTRQSDFFPSILGKSPLLAHTINGLFQGIAGGFALIIPYLFPFLFGMALLEDIGYLPRLAYLLDGFMHRLGLHGSAVVPAILGYGCSVPAIMATRILGEAQTRFTASMMAVLVPCSARMMIILGLVGFYLGGLAAFSIYVVNMIVIVLVGAFWAQRIPEDMPGMLMEIPSYQWPRLKNLFAKTWLRLKDFIIFAWPLLIIGSIVLSLFSYYHIDKIINTLLSPITYLLGLPIGVGMTLIFGILRKELSLIMLMQALGTNDVLSVLTPAQIMTFTFFVVFYFPCLATFAMLGRELGWKQAWIISAIALTLALLIGFMTRLVGSIFF